MSLMQMGSVSRRHGHDRVLRLQKCLPVVRFSAGPQEQYLAQSSKRIRGKRTILSSGAVVCSAGLSSQQCRDDHQGIRLSISIDDHVSHHRAFQVECAAQSNGGPLFVLLHLPARTSLATFVLRLHRSAAVGYQAAKTSSRAQLESFGDLAIERLVQSTARLR